MDRLIAQIRGRLRAALGRPFQVVAIFVCALALALFGFAFALMAAQGWLVEWYQSPIKADATIAGVLALLALIVAGVGERLRRTPPGKAPPPIDLALALPVAVRLAPTLLNPRFVGVASVVLGGVLLGREFRKK